MIEIKSSLRAEWIKEGKECHLQGEKLKDFFSFELFTEWSNITHWTLTWVIKFWNKIYWFLFKNDVTKWTDGIREVIGLLGRFIVTEHWERVRSNRKFDRIKTNVFKKQVQQVWNKHGDELNRDAQNGQRIPHQSLQPKNERFCFS